ncbi:MAG: hypothetical protein HY854_10475 [Burkholderiales bacterium]|nr:hypothetical protein [Burkholderiales bacterium]
MNPAVRHPYVLAAAAVAVAGFVTWSAGRWLEQVPPPPPQSTALAPPVRSGAAPAAVSENPRCPPGPTLAARGAEDGRYQLDAAMALRDRPSSGAFVAVANEAVRQGRPRDAEVALIAACKVAGGPVEIDRILQRLGDLHAGAPAAVMGAAAPAAPPASPDVSIMLSCGAGASTAERVTCSDPELAQLDSDIQRLQAQAGGVARDPAGFRRRTEQALAQRDASCRDRDCLVRWYAQRRTQLLREF